METLGIQPREEATVGTLTRETVTTGAIGPEHLDEEPVGSSFAGRLGMEVAGLREPDMRVEGVGELMLDATGNYQQAPTSERILDRHAALFPMGWSGMRRIRVGSWRSDAGAPMQVVSGPIGRERTGSIRRCKSF